MTADCISYQVLGDGDGGGMGQFIALAERHKGLEDVFRVEFAVGCCRLFSLKSAVLRA